MATEQSEGEPLSVDLPPDLDAWLSEQATEQGLGREQLLQRLLEAARLALAADEEVGGVDELAARVDALESDLDEKVDDVRDRVIQVKKETDRKAPADHGHAELDRLDALEDEIAGLATTLSDLQADVEGLETEVEGNGEAVERVQGRVRQVAAAVVRIQRAAGDDDGDDARLEELRRVAVTRGFREANCAACGESVDIGLLSEATCPHCDAAFHDVTGRSGFFSTPSLVGEEGQ
ncbi:hypothetical protein [Halosegnis marinus]|uniref:CopG family transcriptional regulator n=1 Tax=Halosegnis marinus TaxID=3034023 RepID=A0ABD5ZKS8_9EURY|nr:hypothetical protein [Halosegnis sp. DT85]